MKHLLILACCLIAGSSFAQENKPREDTILKYLPPEVFYDSEFDRPSPQQLAERRSCSDLFEAREKERYAAYLKHVYEPGMKNKTLSAGNKLFLERMKRYLECPTDSCGRLDKLIRPVYRWGSDSLGSVRIMARFNWEKDPEKADTLLTTADKQVVYYTYYSNSTKVGKYTIKQYKKFYSACEQHRSYVLTSRKPGDTLMPAFCTPFKIDLDYKHDSLTDSLLVEYNNCVNSLRSYCDEGSAQVTMAQLKGVPGLYFTSDQRDPWGVWYPTRSVFIRIDDKYVIPLWEFEVEMIECSCI